LFFKRVSNVFRRRVFVVVPMQKQKETHGSNHNNGHNQKNRALGHKNSIDYSRGIFLGNVLVIGSGPFIEPFYTAPLSN
jgi:hypothetical protein